ncbi:FAST kinase domain-containing protein 5, mitochondrial [Coccinella septempunctata]|uniref:FAST kinase domain-containing protein 5, mitochondrial n=1 Tax=Coccinella septempunctata TaxID=41139 RepID=UPI001D078D81|nr:FAST kinase domain-containing protein 5, mitochondrial [Coccinella septempunctata]
MLKLEQSFSKFFFRFGKISCSSCAALQKICLVPQRRNFHISPILFSTRKLKGIENEYMFQLISKNGLDYVDFMEIEEVKTPEEFEDLLNRDYRKNNGCAATTILNTFKAVEKFCCRNQITISDPRFDKLVDGLMDHCRKLTDDEIVELLFLLARYPKCQSYRDHNYHDVWSCLDDVSRERVTTTDTDFLFEVANAWYQLDLGKLGEYVFDMLDVLAKRSNHLTKDHVVKAFFYMNICRRKQVPFEFERVVDKYIDKFSIEELGIIALGYFKTQSKIKLESILMAMIKAVKKECSTVNQITLSSILKVLRFSKMGSLVSEMDQMLDVLLGQIDRLSTQCCLHIAIIGTSLIHYHEKSMVKATQKIVDRMENTEEVRLKDIERILIASTMVDYRPKINPDLFEVAFKEIHQQRRITELASFPRILPCVLGTLSLVNMYSYELMDRVLDTDYIFSTYGKSIGNINRDIFSLDCCIDIECPDYKGRRLSPNLKYRLVKWLLEFIPSYDQYKKLTAYDKLHLDVEENLLSIVGNRDALKVDYVVPHFGRADIILCKDKTTNKFIEPPGFERYILGDVKYAWPDPNLSWYAFSIIGWNNTIRNTSRPVGLVTMKQRHLRKIGYNSKLVIWNQYMNLSKGSKLKYIESLLR